MKRRSFIKAAAATIAVFTPVWLVAKPKPSLDPSKELYGVSEAVKSLPEIRKVNEYIRECWIDDKRVPFEKWYDFEGYPHKHMRRMETKALTITGIDPLTALKHHTPKYLPKNT